MDHNEKATNRPLDMEELSADQIERVVGGVQGNTASFNASYFNTASFNASNFNTADFNTAKFNTVNISNIDNSN